MDDVASELVTGAWRRLVFQAPDPEPGGFDRYAYAFCLLEQLYRALRRRDIFAATSECWADPRAQLLSGEAWDRARPDVLVSLRLPVQPDHRTGRGPRAGAGPNQAAGFQHSAEERARLWATNGKPIA